MARKEMNSADSQMDVHPSTSSDRRVAKREVLIVRKMVLAEIIIGDLDLPRIHYIYINDISKTGINLSSDIQFSKKKNVKMKLFLKEPISVELQLIWKKEIGMNNYASGMEFVKDSGINETGVPSLMRWVEPYFEKASFLINSTLFVETDLAEPYHQMYIYTVNVSQGRMELMNSVAIPEERPFALTFSLRHGIPAITTRGQVIHQMEMAADGGLPVQARNYSICIEFLDQEPVRKHLMEALCEKPPADYQT
jgi:hypothetical protein